MSEARKAFLHYVTHENNLATAFTRLEYLSDIETKLNRKQFKPHKDKFLHTK